MYRLSGGAGGGAGGRGGREGVVLCTQWRELAAWGNVLLLSVSREGRENERGGKWMGEGNGS